MGLEERVIVTGSRDTTVVVWSIGKKIKSGQPPLKEESPLHILYGHLDEVSCIALSAPLDLVISASIGGDVLFHTLQSGEYVRQLQLPHGETWTGRRITYLYPLGGGAAQALCGGLGKGEGER